MKTRRQIVRAVLVLSGLAAVLGAVPLRVMAAGGGGGGDDRPMPVMKPQDPAYTAAVQAIEAKQFARAIPLLEDVVTREPDNADAYNWLAYATRKNGDPERSIPIYEKALALDPRHRGAHEYIGEAYLALGDVAKAKEHLARLDKICFFSCSEYRDLKRAIANYEKNGGKPKPAAAR